MSKKLGWVIKLVSWFTIYFIFSMSFDGDMPLWAYFIVVFLCVVVQGVVERFVKPDNADEDASAEAPASDEKKDNDKQTE